MRSWMTMDTQKMISSMHGLEMVESMKSDEVELYFGLSGTGSGGGWEGSCGMSSAIASSCRARGPAPAGGERVSRSLQQRGG